MKPCILFNKTCYNSFTYFYSEVQGASIIFLSLKDLLDNMQTKTFGLLVHTSHSEWSVKKPKQKCKGEREK